MILYVLLGSLLAVALLILITIGSTHKTLLNLNAQAAVTNERLGCLREDVQAVIDALSGVDSTIQHANEDTVSCLQEIQSLVQDLVPRQLDEGPLPPRY